MRNIGRKFCDKVDIQSFKNLHSVIQKSILERELFILRETFGKSIASIAIGHGLNIDDNLVTIIPFNNIFS